MANEQNLKPFTGADDPRRMNGRPKGRKNLATLIRELEEEDFDWSKIPKLSDEAKENLKSIGSPLKAIVLVATTQALTGNKEAREWLRRAGYGDKLDVTSKGESIAPKIVSAIEPNARTQSETASSDPSDQ
jgi:hypothetical protein